MKNRLTLAGTIVCVLLTSALTHGQSISPATRNRETDARAIAAVSRLERDVIVYRSLAEFEENGKLARVSLQTFARDLLEVTNELQPLLEQMSPSRSKMQIINALDCYRDGLFWWRQIDQPRVVNVSALRYAESNRTPTDAAFLANIPYTVAINWRQAQKYLRQAELTLRQP